MTTLITGAAGFLAGHLAPVLGTRFSGPVVGADLLPVTRAGFDTSLGVDLREAGPTDALLARVRPARIFHLVGLLRGTDEDLQVSNVETTRHLLRAVQRHAPGAIVVLLGSAAEYGTVPPERQPVHEAVAGGSASAYGQAKRQVSALAREAAAAGLRVVVARPFNVIGPGMPDTLVAGALIARLRAALAADPPGAITIGRTSAVRDFIAAADVVEGLLAAGEHGAPGEAYNLCTGVGHSIEELLELLLAQAGRAIRVETDPALLRGDDVDRMIGDWSRAREVLRWYPTHGFEETLVAAWRASA